MLETHAQGSGRASGACKMPCVAGEPARRAVTIIGATGATLGMVKVEAEVGERGGILIPGGRARRRRSGGDGWVAS